MNGNDAPCALDAELLEKGNGHDLLAADEGVRVDEGAADDGDDDDAEPTAKYLGGVTNNGAASHGTKVGDDLGHGYGVGGKAILIFD